MSGIFGSSNAQSLPNQVPALNVQQSSYGIPVQIIYGTNRVAGNLIWYSDFDQVLVSTGGQSGKGGISGGGGKGGGSQQYNYFASFMIGICEGTITGIGQAWASKQTTDITTLGGVVFTGALNQAPWGYLTTNHPTQADGYNRMAYTAFANYALGTSAETPQFSFEVFGLLLIGNGNFDAYADHAISDFLTRMNFPAGNIGSFTNFANYVNSMGFFISPIVDQQRQGIDWLNEWMDTLNSEFVWSGGLLSIVPYGDVEVSGNGFTYTPDLTPIYALTDDDFIVDGDEDPVEIERADLTDAYNRVPIEYTNRADQYNIETYIAEDQGAIDQYGVRIGPTLPAHHVTDPNVAQVMIYLKLWRSIYIDKGNSYTFKLPWNYILLDPMDLVSLTTGTLLNNKLVRIKKIEEDENGELTFTCEDVPGAIAAPALYSTQGTQRFTANYNSAPSSVNMPVFFESPLALVQSSAVELDVAVSGAGTNWGGCQIWVSLDGLTYQFLQNVNGAARMGVLTADLPIFTPAAGQSNIDTVNTLAVNMSESRSSFNNSAANNDAAANNTLCWVDGELTSFGNDDLTSQYNYNLTYLNRGAYGSTISDHPIGKNFVRFDDAVIRYGLDQSRVGQTLYFKFLSYNVYGGGLQELANVSAYPYTITGAALLTPLANPANVSVSFVDNIARLSWTPITDIRYPILYEIRKGTDFASAQIVGTTATSDYLVFGTDTYWVTALYITPFNVPVYSSVPPSISVTEPSITQYLIDSEEEDPSWTGTVAGGAAVVGGTIQLTTDSNILDSDNVLPIPNVLTYQGDVAASGSYTIPTGNRIFTNSVSPAKVIMNWTLSALSVNSDVTNIADVTTTPDITGEVSSSLVQAVPQIRVSQDGGSTWSDWQNWVPGVYPGNGWDFRILIYTLDLQVIAILSTLSYEVDVPIAIQTGTVTTSASVTTNVTFPDEDNIAPAINITILNIQNGDYPVLGTVTTSGFAVDVYNGVSRVVRDVKWTSTGY